VFENKSPSVDTWNDIRPSGHSLTSLIKNPPPYCHGTVALASFTAVVWLLHKLFSNQEEESFEIEQGCLPYYQALPPSQREVLIGRELYLNQVYRIQTFRTENLNRLLDQINFKVKDENELIQGLASYRITDNPTYQQSFQYEPPKIDHDLRVTYHRSLNFFRTSFLDHIEKVESL